MSDIRQHPNYNLLQDLRYISDFPIEGFIDIADCDFMMDTLSKVPYPFRRSLLDEYEQFYSEYQYNDSVDKRTSRKNANTYFSEINAYVEGQTFLNHSDGNLRTKAKRYASSSARLIGADANYVAACHFTENRNISVPHKNWQDLSEQWDIAQQALLQLDDLADTNTKTHTKIAVLTQEIKEMQSQWNSIKARLVSDQWWTKQLIKMHDRQFEQAAIRFARVRKHRQVYVSDTTLDRILSRQKRSLEIMEGLLAVSDDGDEVEMLDIIKSSPANPAIRRAELMNRLHGFEQYAESKEHVAEFYTLTAPSKYHPNSSKYNHWTPRQTQQDYFSPLWARIRAKFKDKNLAVYGFRIAEPHCDACPHWHILLFMPKPEQLTVREILKDYALREDRNESGAKKNRFKYEAITKDKGSAIGYIAKYISKNVDGFGMDNDKTDDGSDLAINESAQRVRAWASVWGIRQFQQIGGSSISIWRELRRLKDNQQNNETIEAARKAADNSDWKAYLEVQGGINTPMKNQPIQLHHEPYCDENTGELHSNQYGEIIHCIKGLQVNNTIIMTRLKHWTIQEKAVEEIEKQETAKQDHLLNIPLLETSAAAVRRLLTPMPCSSEAPRLLTDIATLDAATALAFDLPWSSVNNCRNPEIAAPENDSKFIKAIETAYQNHVNSGKKVSINQKTFVKTVLKMI